MSVLWTGDEIREATDGRLTTGFVASGISIDTRTLEPGDLFVALADQRDGHDFVAQALNKGAAGALVSRIPEGVDADAPLCLVGDVMAALEALGRAGRARARARVVAITGSVGKTSTKDMMLATLSRQGRAHGSAASYNNHWGVPLTLALLPRDADFAVIEIGMNHPGEIAPLARMAAPDVAVVTTVAPAHLEAFDGIEAIAREKGSIFQALGPEGVAIFNGDLPVSDILRDAAGTRKIVTFGEGEADDLRASTISLHDTATVVQAQNGEGPYLFKVAAPGRHFAINALAVLAAVKALGADPVIAATDLGQWTPPPGRGQREVIFLDPADDRLSVELIDDAYNANPASMAAGLEVLAAATPKGVAGRVSNGRRIAVLGDMLELGPQEAALHAALGDLAQMASVDVVHCVGKRMKHLYRALPEARRGLWVQNADELAAQASTLIEAGDVVLIKGSKGSQVSKVVDAIRKLGHPPADQR